MSTTLRKRSRSRRFNSSPLRLECLESRALLTTFFVDGDVGSRLGDGSDTNPYLSINQAVQAAIAQPGDDEVVIRPRSGGAVYTEQVNIQGGNEDSGHLTVRGASADRADVVLTSPNGFGFYIDAGFDVTVRDLTITETYLAGVMQRGENLVVAENLDISLAGYRPTESIAQGYNTAIVHQNGDLTVRDSQVARNHQGIFSAQQRDPNNPDLTLTLPGNLNIENTVSSGNRFFGLLTRLSTGHVNVSNFTSFGNNWSGLRAFNLDSIDISDSRFFENAQHGVSMESVQNAVLTDNTYDSNWRSGLYAEHTNTPQVVGGEAFNNGLYGIKLESADGALIDGIEVHGNGIGPTPNENVLGGGIGIVPATTSSIIIRNSFLHHNEADSGGGGLRVANDSSQYYDGITDVLVTNSVVSDNVGTTAGSGAGGGITTNGRISLSLQQSKVQRNRSNNTGGIRFVGSPTSSGQQPVLEINQTEISDNVSVDNDRPRGAGGIFQQGGATRWTNSTLHHNSGGFVGGAIVTSQSGRVENVTIAENEGANVGGVVLRTGLGPMEIVHTTVTGNRGSITGGLRAIYDNVYLANTVVAENMRAVDPLDPSTDVPHDLLGPFNSIGGNFFGESASAAIAGDGSSFMTGTPANPLDPELGPLQMNGGSTPTRVPSADSPLVDNGIALVNAASTDQRGVARPLGFGFDIGSVEFVALSPNATVSPDKINLNSADKGKKSLSVTLESNSTFDASTVDISSVVWAGASVVDSELSDVDGDGDLDLVLEFLLRETDLVARYAEALDTSEGETTLTVDVPLEGTTTDGQVLRTEAAVDLLMTGKKLRQMLAS